MKLTTRFFMRLVFLSVLLIQGMLTVAMATAVPTNQLNEVRTWPSPDNTRVVLEFLHKPSYKTHYLKYPDRLVIDLQSTSTDVNLTKIKHKGPLVNNLRESASISKSSYRIVVDLNKASQAKMFVLPKAKPYGHRLVIDLPHNQLSTIIVTKPKQPAQGRNIIIAIDAGHGGDDPGASGRYSHEKKITLQIAKRLLKKINQQVGMSAFLIREGDYFVGLHQRTAIARKGEADFLVSIHADGFTSARPRGASVLVLSKRRATTEQGRWMENNEAHSELIGGAGKMMQGSSNRPYLQKMVLDMSMGNSMAVGFKVGYRVVNELKKVTPLHQAAPVHASLAVLKSPDIPSILVEAGFITNRTEEKLLNQASHQNKITNAVFNGIYKHFIQSPPQNTLFAQKKRVIKHTVRSGESLSILSERYSVSLSHLKAYNHLGSNSLLVDQVLNIPPNYKLAVTPEAPKQFLRTEPSARVHRVRSGESLSVIAEQYGTTTQTLKSFNNLPSMTLAIGQKVKIPSADLDVPVVLAASVHRVRGGEALSVIAEQYGTTTQTLKSFNNLSSMTLAIGQKIKIPGDNEVIPVRPSSHKVSSGESLSVIAERYGVTSDNLKAYNKLNSSSLLIGQVLQIPRSDYVASIPLVVRVHKVEAGESLSVIAQRYDTSSIRLKAYNGLSSSTVFIGQQMKIPLPDYVIKEQLHKVKVGESLSVIAQGYDTSSARLKAYNGLSSSTVFIGQQIKIPAPDYVVKEQLHKVKAGESLSVIAQRYDTTSARLKAYNRLSSSIVFIGQNIKIPSPGYFIKEHKVRSGESLSVIASRYGTTSDVIKEFNKLSSTLLRVGQVLTIPVS
ncbi:N-acetylmuramoyl-L-alanine amidase [Psychromonas ingrahamii 37]|uniref:N-acetylmuramoyl-L-alanine amidase n=1 Tax=Psychromonas ingrahamii (strain DSM 17664 / CCUG 51855 / 37) TaxID=357804 RepID=A1SZL3_PSYIN|nr:LysM peptidoglycan-binding domain-containing protein [Psychromonas ingrahamii]ABM04928.1 N-acetylmuramoyl-L-alanine amidase [Psychromonas ingrahamii 37]